MEHLTADGGRYVIRPPSRTRRLPLHDALLPGHRPDCPAGSRPAATLNVAMFSCIGRHLRAIADAQPRSASRDRRACGSRRGEPARGDWLHCRWNTMNHVPAAALGPDVTSSRASRNSMAIHDSIGEPRDATAASASDAISRPTRQNLTIANLAPNPVESRVLRASYNGHYLSFPSPGALIRTTNHARSNVVFSPGSTKNHCLCGIHGDASFRASADIKKLMTWHREVSRHSRCMDRSTVAFWG
ncbi:hypothetical protein DM82_2276 [Burkholderia oklahomensis]|uniref:Uncharacterized protein n=1 Tax=Burkholderia oklahomensis TaxID=342113 RepID=A0AAI8B5Z9_9BURK|nr:hypothetical protein DM82_2276 [Burkholderia oklahomensis]